MIRKSQQTNLIVLGRVTCFLQFFNEWKSTNLKKSRIGSGSGRGQPQRISGLISNLKHTEFIFKFFPLYL